LLAIFFRHRRLVLVSFLSVALGTLLYGVLAPSYESHMKVLVRRGRVDPSSMPRAMQGAGLNQAGVTEEEVNSEVELMRDEEILRTVVEESGLARRSWQDWFGADEAARERRVRKVGERLVVKPIRKTALLEVSYSARDPKEAALVLRCLGKAYLERHVRVQQSSGQFEFFEEQAARAGKELGQAQTELVNFSQAEGVVSAALERDNALQRLNEAETNYRQLQLEVAANTRRRQELLRQLMTLPERSVREERKADNGELLGKLKARLLELQLKRTELLTKFEPSYRLVQEVDAQIAETKAAVTSEEARPLEDRTTEVNPDYQWAQAELLKAKVELNSLAGRTAEARRVINEYRRTADQLGERALQQETLLRGLKIAEANYLLYVNKREEARIGDALDQNGILNVSIAERPSVPVIPQRSALAFGVIGIVVGSVVSTTAAFVADRIDPTFRTSDEVVLCLATPVLATLPQRNGQLVRGEFL
jgi:uncharacterized protein involved in exopolysaccharide biosynthesis